MVNTTIFPCLQLCMLNDLNLLIIYKTVIQSETVGLVISMVIIIRLYDWYIVIYALKVCIKSRIKSDVLSIMYYLLYTFQKCYWFQKLLLMLLTKKCYWVLIIGIILEGEKCNSSLINIYFYLLAKMLSSSCLFYSVHCILWCYEDIAHV